ncbi:MAG: hypothetical protein COA78_03025 [Blastopirellula sp.]|nr:MAG: hypothetical protein COA78_03025 [Blastopirellula sp.]
MVHLSKYMIPILGIAFLLSYLVPIHARSPFDAAPINYSTTEPTGKIAQLQQLLDQGQASLEYDEEHGYLPSVLKQLNVPISSQGLVFSKTSFQRRRITAKTPRAVYFNENVYIGWVQQGDVLEISVVDPKLGTVFYSLDQKKTEKPQFTRQVESCMLCHSSTAGYRVPGHVVQSVQVNEQGYPVTGTTRYRIDHTSPFKQRWGGWYVTGTHGDQRHLGNLTFDSYRKPNLDDGANLLDLSERIDTTKYLSSHSDIVALMVLEHQTTMHNVFTSASFQTRKAIYEEEQLKEETASNDPARLPLTQLRINNAAEEVIKYLLFCEEIELEAEIKGTNSFAKDFTTKGLKDSKNRSLREFDLTTRMFKYPCSYLIHSESFDSQPVDLKKRIYFRLNEILSNKDSTQPFQHLSPDARKAIREILSETKPEYKKYLD